MRESVLITGGAGYLGSVLAEVLLDNDYNVTVFDNLMYKQTSLLHLCDNKCKCSIRVLDSILLFNVSW